MTIFDEKAVMTSNKRRRINNPLLETMTEAESSTTRVRGMAILKVQMQGQNMKLIMDTLFPEGIQKKALAEIARLCMTQLKSHRQFHIDREVVASDSTDI